MKPKPLYETPVPLADIKRSLGPEVVEFTEKFCKLTKDGYAAGAGTPIILRPWTIDLFSKVYARRAGGKLRHREALIGLPRKNSKSANGSSMALHALLFSGEGAEVYSCASDKDQAKIVFNVAKRMVEMDPSLSKMIQPYRDVLEVPSTGSIYKALSSEAFTKEGLNPSTVVYDELHAAPNRELYDVMSLGSGTRKNPLLIAITTAGVKYDTTGEISICYDRYLHGVKIAEGKEEDDFFFMSWFGAPKGADYKDPKVWEAANPAYGDFLDPDDFRAALKRVHENEFRTKRLNQWMSQHAAWLPNGAWPACFSDAEFTEPGKGVVLGFDGSMTGDSTALVAVTVSASPQIKVLGHWQKPADWDEDDDYRVPREEVKDAIRAACREYRVREVAADEWGWLDAMEELAAEGVPIVAFPQTLGRMAPATQRFYEAVVNRRIRHNNDQRLAMHLDNAQLEVSSRGSRLRKESANSKRRIDLAVAAVMALDRADFWLNEEGPDTWQGVPVERIGFVW